MLVEKYSGETFEDLVNFFNIEIKGILHVGAHKCEEHNVYLKYASNKNIYWIEAIDELVKENLLQNPELNILNECVSNKDGEIVDFKLTNNTLSSSILNLGLHKKLHPQVVVTKTLKKETKTLKSILQENNLLNKFNMLILDLQGAELLALKGLKELILGFEYIYTEVNEKEIYKECAILKDLDIYLSTFGFKRKYLNTLNGYGNALYTK